MDVLWLLKSDNITKKLGLWLKGFGSRNHFLQDLDLLDPIPFVVGTISGLAKYFNSKFSEEKKIC